MRTNCFLTVSYSPSRHRSILRFHVSASFLKPAPGNHHGKWMTVPGSSRSTTGPKLIWLTERYYVEDATFCLGDRYALKSCLREGNVWVIPWGCIDAVRDRQADLTNHAKMSCLRCIADQENILNALTDMLHEILRSIE